MSDDILLKQILGPFKEYRKVQPKEEETIDDGTGVIKVLFFPGLLIWLRVEDEDS